MIDLKTEADLVLYRKTGQIAGEILMRLIPEVKEGLSTYHSNLQLQTVILKK